MTTFSAVKHQPEDSNINSPFIVAQSIEMKELVNTATQVAQKEKETRENLSKPIRAPFYWMKLAICRYIYRLSYCVFSRKKKLSG